MFELILRSRASRLMAGRRRGQSVVETLITVAVIAVGAFVILGLIFGDGGTMHQLFDDVVGAITGISFNFF